ncbi:MAG: thioredoxin family protein [Firmicutes bacterium]|nr:thioredoxin family protein [Bacillota bacterium]
MENPHIRAEAIEASEFPELSQQYAVYGVPKSIINEKVEVEGAVPDAAFLQQLLQAVK